jgi:hypothetical protein
MSESPRGLMDLLPGRISVAFAALMHAAVGGFVVASGQLLPTAAAAGLFAVWLAVAAGIWRFRHDRPLIVLLLPFIVPALLYSAVRWLVET